MTSNFPYSADSFTTKVNNVDIVYAEHVNSLQDSIVAVQAEIVRTYRPDLKPANPSAYDDEFESATLDASWTATNCVEGTVNLLEDDPASGIYDLSTFSGLLTLQSARDDDGSTGIEGAAAFVRKAVSLGTNCKIVTKLNAGGYPTAGICLSGPSGFSDNNYIYITSYSNLASGKVNITGTPTNLTGNGTGTYLVLQKSGNYYSAWFSSPNGLLVPTYASSPNPNLFQFEITGTINRLTLFSYWSPASTEVNELAPMAGFDFVRYFTNNTPLVNA